MMRLVIEASKTDFEEMAKLFLEDNTMCLNKLLGVNSFKLFTLVIP